MISRVTLKKNGSQYQALLLRLEHGRVRCDTHSCAEILTLTRERPEHRIYACHDETIRLYTYSGCRPDLEVVMYLESYRQPVTHGTSRAVRVMYRNHGRR